MATAVATAAQAGQLAGALDVMARATGQITYAIDRELGPTAVDGARDAFDAWDAANDDIALAESETWTRADVRVARTDVFCARGHIVNGCACLGMSALCPAVDNALRGWGCPVPDGATIGVAPGVYGTDGSLAPYTREQMRDLVAHEFGHNLGLAHNEGDRLHLMHGLPDMVPYSDRGYTVPAPLVNGNMTPGIPADEWAAPESCARP